MTETEQKPKSELTEFGAELYTLGLARGLRSMAALARRMEESDCGVSRQSLVAYANGTRRVPPSLGKKLIKSLELSDTEQRALAWAIAYGQPDENGRDA